MMILVFSTEVSYTKTTLDGKQCVQALKNATKVDDTLLTSATIIYSIYDGFIIIIFFYNPVYPAHLLDVHLQGA